MARPGPLSWVGVVALCVVVVSTAVAQPSAIGRFDLAPEPLPFFPVHVAVLPTGKVIIWPGDMGISGNDPRLWDPAATVPPTTSLLAKPGYDLFCTGHSFLADGRLFVTGGHIENNVGLKHAYIYNPFVDAWKTFPEIPDMNAGRWYPTNTTLANGDVLVVSGSVDRFVGVNKLPQVFEVASGTWRDLTNAQMALSLYPRMHLAPNGRVFLSAGQSRYLDTNGPNGTGAWSVVATQIQGGRDYGSSVMYDVGNGVSKILVMGGGDPPKKTAEVIDLNASSPTWRLVGEMKTARRQLNATVLPDGKVLVTGGTSGPGFNNKDFPVFEAELWDPTSEQWTPMASSTAQIPRLYHSAAVLLPDGRVLLTGGNGYLQAEVYSPPYLFQGTRPTINSAPAHVDYGETFAVGTPDAAAIDRVTWIRLSSVTHAFNQDQRFSSLSFSPAGGGLNVVAPASPNLAPPGYYLLFILSGGVPSVAKIVHLASGSPGLPTVSISDATVTEGNTGTVNAVFTVSLSAASSQTVTVQYATADGTAIAGSDYEPAAGTLTFSPGQLTKTIAVAVNGDTLAEQNETFFVNLSNPTNATLGDGQGVGTITDDDSGASITVLAPNGGQIWQIGGRREIRWGSTGLTGPVKIELSRDGGTSWVALFASTANDGSQVWTVTGPATTQARIRITSGSVNDVSDGTFSITN